MCFLDQRPKGLSPITTDECDGMPALCALLPFLLPLFYFPTPHPFPLPPPSTQTSTLSLSKTPGGAGQTKPSLQRSFAGKLFTKPQNAVRLPARLTPQSMPGFHCQSHSLLSSFFFCTLVLPSSLIPPPSFVLTTF